VLSLPVPVSEVLRALAAQNMLGGYALEEHYPELGESLLVCATETRTTADIAAYRGHLQRILERRKVHVCPIGPKM
jgi:glycine dehydrogenase subunit 1